MPDDARRPIVRRAVAAVRGRGTAPRISASPCRRCSTTTATLHGAICLFTDLTAVKDLEEQLRLKDSLATVGELTAGIAHEFRNGLATIHGYSKLFDLESAAGRVPAATSRAFAPRRSRSARSSPTS